MLKQTADLPGSLERDQASRRLWSLTADLCQKPLDLDVVGRDDSGALACPGLPGKDSDGAILVLMGYLHPLDTWLATFRCRFFQTKIGYCNPFQTQSL